METDRLKYFCAVVELGSLTKASEVLGISHSGLSKAISVLQSETELELFRPKGRGLELTKEGRVLYEKSLEILKLMEGLKEKQTSPSQAFAKVGLSGALAATLSGKIVEALATPTRIYQLDVGEIEDHIFTEKIDFAIASALRPQPDFEYLSLGKIRLAPLARRDLYQKHKGQVPYVAPLTDVPQNLMGYKSRDGWPHGIERNEAFFVKSYAISLNLLVSGQAAMLAPEFLKKQLSNTEHSFVNVREHKAVIGDREYFLIKHKASEESKAMKQASRVIRKVCTS